MADIADAQSLVASLAAACERSTGSATMSTSIYDTAWVSMVSKADETGDRKWLFPEAFRLLLDTQLPEGGWEAYNTKTDAILNTMAALLALAHHAKFPEYKHTQTETEDLGSRLQRANDSLQAQLMTWDASASEHVGLEILVPSHLRYLEAEGYTFSFPGQTKLQQLHDAKMRKADPNIIYGRHAMTFLHSLEAFVGNIDFNRLSHHAAASHGSMLGSPSSTAAYLMSLDEWDDGAEEYLRNALSGSANTLSGAVPCAFPTTVFELSWALVTMLEAGLDVKSLGPDKVDNIAKYLETTLSEGGGTVGFAPTMLADADDTAKTITCLSLLGRKDVSRDAMVAKFYNGDFFKTYAGERNPSLSANCNVLKALLCAEEPAAYEEQIGGAAGFLCDCWFDGNTRDKWNHSIEYSHNGLAQALAGVLAAWCNGSLPNLPKRLVEYQIPVMLTEILTRVLQSQGLDGAWGSGSSEITAYAVLTLSTLQNLPWFAAVQGKIEETVEAGRSFIEKNKDSWGNSSKIWVEKISFSSPVLSQAYCISSLAPSSGQRQWTQAANQLPQVPLEGVLKRLQLFKRLPLFKDTEEWVLRLSLLESQLFLAELQDANSGILPRDPTIKQKWLDIIPFTWISCNNIRASKTHTNTLWDMMVASVLAYEADQYMEDVAAKTFADNYEELRSMIVNGTRPRAEQTNGIASSDKSEFLDAISGYVEHFVLHGGVVARGNDTQSRLRRELTAFFLGHCQQLQDNQRLQAQKENNTADTQATLYKDAGASYHSWVHSTSADHTSCPYSFLFYTCIARKIDAAFFADVEQQYIAADVCRHLASMCRQQNDLGSYSRDTAESNLNSLHFPEFAAGASEAESRGERDDGELLSRKKRKLGSIAAYERHCLGDSLERLSEIASESAMEALYLFVDVTDLYGQIYEARDLTSRVK